MMTRRIADPEFGDVEVPAPPTEAEFQDVKRRAMKAMAAQRLWPMGSITLCPECNKKSMVGRDDLTARVPKPGAVLVFHHLRGGKCSNCGVQLLEPTDTVQVEREAGMAK